MARFFISYSYHDSQIAKLFSVLLKKNGHDTFVAEEIIRYAANWSDVIEEELDKCNYFIILLSKHSIASDMVKKELREARKRFEQKDPRPLIFPVRINMSFDESLPYEMGAYLDLIQQARWEKDEDTSKIVDEFLNIVNTPGLNNRNEKNPMAAISLPGETMDSYLIRADEDRALSYILARPQVLLRIHAPTKYGKTSFLRRLTFELENRSYPVVLIDFDILEKGQKNNLDQLLKEFCLLITRGLEKDEKILLDYWEKKDASKLKCKNYLLEHILNNIDQSFVLMLDRVDEIFEYQEVAQEFFTLFRFFYDNSGSGRIGKLLGKMKVVFSYSTDSNKVQLDMRNSAFTVGQPHHISTFSLQEINELARRRQFFLTNEQVEVIKENLGGHPYLTVEIIDYLIAHKHHAKDVTSIKQFFETECEGHATFSAHLDSVYWDVSKDERLKDALLTIIKQEDRMIDNAICIELRALGLISKHQSKFEVSNKLYKDYFSKNLSKN